VTSHFKPVFFFSFVLVLGARNMVVCAQEPGGPLAQEASPSSDQHSQLRGVFLGKDDEPTQSRRVVGRLAILLKTDDGFQRVRPDYPFHSGDRFRFEIAANQDGWLYVLHADSAGHWQQLWPTKVDSNNVQSEQSYEIPASPGVFIFDKETGGELFYVVIRSDKTPPNIGASMPHTGQLERPAKVQTPASKPAPGETINFLVRDPFGETTRGVVFDPGKDDVDPYLYFSAADTTKTARIKFKLHHTN
jgi:hypothetical protein